MELFVYCQMTNERSFMNMNVEKELDVITVAIRERIELIEKMTRLLYGQKNEE